MKRRLPPFLLAAAFAVVAAGVRAQDPKPNPVFVYTGDADLAPFEYLDANRQPSGFNVDLVRALARDAGVRIEIRLGEWNEVRSEFDQGKADLISLSFSEERARAYLWLARTWTVQQSLLFRLRPRPYPSNLLDLAPESIAVQERSLASEVLRALPAPQPAVITTATHTESLNLLQGGAVSAVGGGSLVLRLGAARLGMKDLVELPFRSVPYGLVAAKGRAAEFSWVPSGVARLRDAGTLDALAEKHLVAPGPLGAWSDYRVWVLVLLAVVVMAGVGAWVWNRSLLRRVKSRTREMEEAMQRGEGLMRSLSANEERFQAFMSLSSEGIARLELDEPLAVFRPATEQIQHVVRNARVAECNEAFSRMLRAPGPAALMGRLIGELSDAPHEVEETARMLVEAGYRLVNREVLRSRRSGEARWVSASMVGVVEGGFLKAIWITQQDIDARKEAVESLRVRGQILEAVAFSSTALLEPGSWKEHIPEILERLGEGVGAGCAYVLENSQTPTGEIRARMNHEWTVPGLPSLARQPAFENLIWPADSPMRQALSERKTVATLVRELPQFGRQLLGSMGLKSILIVPIFVRDHWWGLIGFGDFENERIWLDAEVEAIKIAGASLGAALLRQQGEDEVRASEKKHRDIVALAPEGIYQATREGTLVMANQEFARLLGYERSEELIGINLGRSVYFDAAERERLIARYEGVGQAARVEVRLKRRDGAPFWAEMSAHAVEDAAGQFLYFEGFIQDITVRKAAEAERERFGLALERAAEEWHRTFDAVDLAIVVLDQSGRLTRMNRPALEMLGPAYTDVLARTLDEIDANEPWKSAARLAESVLRVREHATARAVDLQTGKTWELSAHLAEAGQGGEERMILVVRDISRLVALQESLRRSETMSAMGSLVAGVAHEVRNPLFSISATVDALESELGEREEYAELTGLLRSQVSRLRQLMRDLLDYGKPPVLRRAPVHPREILRRAIRACAGLARERDVRMTDEAPDELPLLKVDGSRLEQVFQNLLANAIQHSQRGAVVRARVHLVPSSASIDFVIEDDGAGLAKDEIPHLFEPFFSRRKGGTGLGLSVVQRIVESHGGQVRATNREGGGAAFIVRLPASVIETVEAVNG